MYYFYPKDLLQVISYNSFLHRDFVKVRSIRVLTHLTHGGFPDGGSGEKKKKMSANAGDIRKAGSILGSGRCPGEGTGNSLQNFCLENPMDRRT